MFKSVSFFTIPSKDKFLSNHSNFIISISHLITFISYMIYSYTSVYARDICNYASNRWEL